jgi:hypothetical protein
MSDKFLTPKFRGSYCHLLKPQKAKEEGGKDNYSITMVLPKKDKATIKFIAELKAAFKADMVETFGKEIPESALKHYPIRDGDEIVDDDGNTRPEWEGCWVITAKNSNKVGIQVRAEDGRRWTRNNQSGEWSNKDGDDLPADLNADIYSGAWYYASVRTFAWKHETGGKGVSVSLSGVLKAQDDKEFGGSTFSESEFDEVEDGGNDDL